MTIRTLRIFAAIFAIALLGALSATVAPQTAEAGGEKVVAHGAFEGRSNHVTTGGAKVIQSGEHHVLVLEENFSLDGAPAPTIGFGKHGKFDASTEFTKLQSNSGRQLYQLPASLDPGAYDEVYIWCADFSVPLGVAKLR